MHCYGDYYDSGILFLSVIRIIRGLKTAKNAWKWRFDEGIMKRNRLKGWKDFLREEEGMGTVEIILIIVVLIGLVIIFKTQLRALVERVFEKITKDSNTIMS